MATREHEVAAPLMVRLDREQQERLARAAQASGQSLDEFVASALLRAADDALDGHSPLPASQRNDSAGHPLDKIIGIFKDEPLMDELMEGIRADRRAQIEALAED